MRLEESGSFEVGTTAEDAFAYLTDVEAVTHCLPGEIHRIETRGDSGVMVEMTVSQASASEDLRVRFFVDGVDESAARVSYVGHGLGSRVKVDLDGEFSLEEIPNGTRVVWHGAADVGGLLSSLNRGVVEVTVCAKLTETADNVRAALRRLAVD